MERFEKIFTKARKHAQSIATDYEIARPAKKVITIRRESSNGTFTAPLTFKIGDYAEYDSYNLSYYGKIVNITAKTVTIACRFDNDEKHRLDLATFAWRNYNFDLDKTIHDNALTSQCI